MDNNPIYFGEVQPWAKIMKFFFSGVSIVVFSLILFSADHNVRSFLRSLFLSSSTIAIDLLVIYYSIKPKEEYSQTQINLVLYATISSVFCLSVSLIILLLVGNNIGVIDRFVNGSHWMLCLGFFPFIIFSFVINVLRPFERGQQTTIKTEQRPC